MNGGDANTAPAAITGRQAGDAVVLPSSVPTHADANGKRVYFHGWSETDTAKKVFTQGETLPVKATDPYTMPARNVTLYAIWADYLIIVDPQTRTLSFDSNGGNETISEIADIYPGNAIDIPDTMTHDPVGGRNVKFLGWTENKYDILDDGDPVPAVVSDPYIMPDKDVTLYALWSYEPGGTPPVQHTVSFDPNGGTGYIPPVVVEDGGSLTVPPADAFTPPAGKKFKEWNTDPNGGGEPLKPGDSFTPSKDTPLYAIWENDGGLYTLKFDANGGAGAPADITDLAGNKAVTLPDAKPTYGNNYFVGWTTARYARVYSDGETLPMYYAAGTNYVMPTHDVTLYALWTDYEYPPTDKYVVTFDANGGTGEMKPVLVDKSSPTFEVPDNGFMAPKDKRFKEWNTVSDGSGTSYKKGDTLTLTADTTLYAIWTDNGTTPEYALSYNPNGGREAPTGHQVKFADNETVKTVTLKPTIPTHDDVNGRKVVFIGWTTARDTKIYDVGEENKLPMYWQAGANYPMPKRNVVLYALWGYEGILDGYWTVSYDANGGTGEMVPQQIVKGQTGTVKDSDFYPPAGKVFDGWNTQADGNGDSYKPGDSIDPSADMTLYAIWKDDGKRYTLTYNVNGGDEGTVPAPSVGLKVGDKVTLATNIPTHAKTAGGKPVYFHGWTEIVPTQVGKIYTKNETLPPKAADPFVMPARNVTLYAIWADYPPVQPPVQPRTLKFDVNGGNSQKPDDKPNIMPGTRVALPANPTHADVDNKPVYFAGWTETKYEDIYAEGATLPSVVSDPYPMPNRDQTLYALWSYDQNPQPPVEYTVSFDRNGGTGYMDPVKVAENGSMTVPENGFKAPNGKKFKEWNTRSNGQGDSYKPGDTLTPTADTTLFAIWEDDHGNGYTLSFDVNGGDAGTAPAAITGRQPGDAVTLPTTEPTHGKTAGGKLAYFGGWTETPNNGKIYSKGEALPAKAADPFVMPASDVTLYAIWTDYPIPRPVVTATVSFDLNGGEGPVPSAVTQEAGSSMALPQPNPTHADENGRPVYFVGWTENVYDILDPANGDPVPAIVSDPYIVPDKDVTLYALWSYDPNTQPPDRHTVRFDANGGEGYIPPVEVEDGSSLTVPSGKTLKPPKGKKFNGWNTAADGSGNGYEAGDKFTPDDDTTLYAQWVDGGIVIVDGGADVDIVKLMRWDGMDHSKTNEPLTEGYDPRIISKTVEVKNGSELLSDTAENRAFIQELLENAVYEVYGLNGFGEINKSVGSDRTITVRDNNRSYAEIKIVSSGGNLALEIKSLNPAAVLVTLGENGVDGEFMIMTPGDVNFDGLMNDNDWTNIMRWTLLAKIDEDTAPEDHVVTINHEDYNLWALAGDMTSMELTGDVKTMVNNVDWITIMRLLLQAWKN